MKVNLEQKKGRLEGRDHTSVEWTWMRLEQWGKEGGKRFGDSLYEWIRDILKFLFGVVRCILKKFIEKRRKEEEFS